MNEVTTEQFDAKLRELVAEHYGEKAEGMLAIAGVYELVSEELNNEVLKALDEEKECDFCGGSGQCPNCEGLCTTKCPTCEGESDGDECDECEGRGEADCGQCGGTGECQECDE